MSWRAAESRLANGHPKGFHYRRKTDGLPLSFQCQGKRLIAVRVFFQWLTRQHHLMFNPASELELPRPEKRLPRHILTIAEVEQVINTCDTTEPTGLALRDRAMLETLYSTGMRRSELVELHIDDVDHRAAARVRRAVRARRRDARGGAARLHRRPVPADELRQRATR